MVFIPFIEGTFILAKLKNSNNGDIVKNTAQGTISFQFKNGISVDITLDGSIRVTNKTANAVAAVNASGNISAVMHPVGFMYKKDEIVHVQANDMHSGNHKLAKIRPTCIHFKAVKSPLVYLVDEAGVRTNFSENFMRMDRDITLDVLYKDCRHGAMYVNVCNDLLSDIKCTVLETGTEWKLYDVSVVQENVHGFVRVIKDGREKFEIRSSASVGTINLYSDTVDCTASHGINHHFFVKKNSSRIHYEVRNKFMVRYGGYHTGFNECDEVSFF
ncbi:uncharacterized protein LOC113557852 [Rhopalosiphum maidis]|uniref:uncharacterized protein LOC113557852 n=1 Tax=Rhopalosiphum maidis TaxID=43146 RepID=UPI000EFF6345|nr:uncharacterized protein LOC113557852 [Rhopalosiphum maidis]